MTEGAKGRFVWYDLMTTDPEGAKAFYSDVAGWGLQAWEVPEGMPPYDMWTVGDVPMGGVMTLPDEAREQGAPPHWLSYVAVPDTDATTSRAKELGATVYVEPMDIPTVGRFSVLGDPQGAVIAVFTPAAEPPGHAGEPLHGHVSWHELATSDHEAAWAFYHDLFGWEKGSAHDMGGGLLYQEVSAGGQANAAMYTKTPDMPGPPAWCYYVKVDDLDAALGRVNAGGGQVLNGPMDVPGGDRIAQCMDPQGAVFALHASG